MENVVELNQLRVEYRARRSQEPVKLAVKGLSLRVSQRHAGKAHSNQYGSHTLLAGLPLAAAPSANCAGFTTWVKYCAQKGRVL